MTGREFKAVRKRAGYSAREIGQYFGKSDTFVYELERLGRQQVPGRWVVALRELPGVEHAPDFDAKTGGYLLEVLKKSLYASGDAHKNYEIARALLVLGVDVRDLEGSFADPMRS